MPELREGSAVQPGRQGMVWFQHVVRSLLRTPGAVGSAHAGSARGDVGRHRAQARASRALGCFASAAGEGCALSASERTVARYQGAVKAGRSFYAVAPRTLGCFAGVNGEGCALSPDELRIARVVRDLPMSWEVA